MRPAWISGAFAVCMAASAGAAAGVVIGYLVGMILLEEGVIQPGSSVHMPSAVAGALGVGLGWVTGATAAMVATGIALQRVGGR